MEETEIKPPASKLIYSISDYFYLSLGFFWTFLQNYGWPLWFIIISYLILKDPVRDFINGYMARARLRAAKDPKRVATLDEERKSIREQQQRNFLVELERKAQEEKEEKERKANEQAAANAELRAAGNPTTEATRQRGTFMGPSRPGEGGGGGAYRFGNDRRRRP
jgi:hypothetical protein